MFTFQWKYGENMYSVYFVYASMHVSARACVFQHTKHNKCMNKVLPYLCLDDDDDVAADVAPRIHSLFADVLRTDKSFNQLLPYIYTDTSCSTILYWYEAENNLSIRITHIHFYMV